MSGVVDDLRGAQLKDASFWAFFEIAPIALTVGLTSATSAGATRFNRHFTSLFGYTSEDVPTVDHWWPLAYPDEAYRAPRRAEWFQRLESRNGAFGGIEPMEGRVRCKDGSSRDIEFNTATVGVHHIVALVDLTERNRAREELAARVTELELALAQVKVLRGLVPLCAWCKKLRDDEGYWSRVEDFLAKNTDSKVTHGICPQCQVAHFGSVPRG